MKTSSKLLVVVSSIALAIVIGVIVASRFVLTSEAWKEAGSSNSIVAGTAAVEQIVDEKDFGALSTMGSWDVFVERGGDYSVRLVLPEDLLPFLEIRNENGELSIGFDDHANIRGSYDAKAFVTMPDLRKFASTGDLKLDLTDLNGEALRIETTGAFSMSGSGCNFGSLILDSSGATKVDFGGNVVDSAQVRLSGAGLVRLHLGTGELTGSLSGACRLEYSGSPSKVSVQTSGISKLVQVDGR